MLNSKKNSFRGNYSAEIRYANFVFSFNILVSLDDEFPFETNSGSTNDGHGVISHDDLIGKFAFLYHFQA